MSNSTRALVSGLAAVHLGITMWHGGAHEALGVSLPAWKLGFVYLVVLLAPTLAGIAVWTRFTHAALALFFVAMLGSFMFGVYHHYVAVSPDHIHHLPGPAGAATQSFIQSAAWLAAVELLGSMCVGVMLTRRRLPAGATYVRG